MGSKKELQAAIAVLGLCMLVFGCTKTAESENSKKQVKIGDGCIQRRRCLCQQDLRLSRG